MQRINQFFQGFAVHISLEFNYLIDRIPIAHPAPVIKFSATTIIETHFILVAAQTASVPVPPVAEDLGDMFDFSGAAAMPSSSGSDLADIFGAAQFDFAAEGAADINNAAGLDAALPFIMATDMSWDSVMDVAVLNYDDGFHIA